MSACHIRKLGPEGLVPVSYAAASLAEAVRHEPQDGIYTVSNTIARTRVVAIDWHFDRLEDSARREGIPLKLDRRVLRSAIRTMIEECGFGSVKFRVTVPRDGAPLYISIEEYPGIDPDLYRTGVRCITTDSLVRSRPASKTTAWMHRRVPVVNELPAGIYEAILVGRGGELLEGTSSNFYAVTADRGASVHTATDGVLKGIAQRIVLEVAPTVCRVDTRPVRRAELPTVREAFLSSASRGVVPIVEIDGRPIGDGRPGEVTGRIMSEYESWVRSHLEEL